jgi:hypothetical protein
MWQMWSDLTDSHCINNNTLTIYKSLGVYGDGASAPYRCGFTESEIRTDFDLEYLVPKSPCCHFQLTSPSGAKYHIVATPMLYQTSAGFLPIPIQTRHPFGKFGGGSFLRDSRRSG